MGLAGTGSEGSAAWASASLALLDNVPALPASRRLASAHAALGTRHILILGQAPKIEEQIFLKGRATVVTEAMDLHSNPSRLIPETDSADFAFNRGSVNAFNFIALQPIDML